MGGVLKTPLLLACVLAVLGLPVLGAPDTTSDALDRAARLHAEDKTHAALETLLEHVESGVQRLDPDVEASRALADELEVALAFYDSLAGAIGDEGLTSAHARRFDVDPAFGMLYARAAWMRGEVTERLHPIYTWQFAGPFDNERGQGMLTSTAAELQPDSAETYAGKVRDIGWRLTPPIEPRHGVVRFSRLLDPAAQVCVVARTWVHATEDQEVVLLLGGGEEVRAWFQGECVLAALGARFMAPDAHAIPVTLRAGWNELALKVGSHDGSPSFFARLVEPGTARPLEFTTTPMPPEGVAPLVLAEGEPETITPRPGAVSRYAGDDSDEGLYRQALLEQDRQGTARHLRPGSGPIERSERFSLRDDLMRLSTLRVRGARPEEEDISPWLGTLDRMLGDYGPLPLLLRTRARHSWEHQPTYARALALLDHALSVAPYSVPARFDHARVLNLAGQRSLAMAEWRELAEDPTLATYPDYAWRVARNLPDHHPHQMRLMVPARAQGRGEAIDAVREYEERARGEFTAADVHERLQEKLGHHPWSITARRTAAEQMLLIGESEEAERLLLEALEFAPDKPVLHRHLSRAYLVQGKKERALASLSTVIDLDFAGENERRLLDHLRATGVTAFHQPFLEGLDEVLSRRSSDVPVAEDVAPREVLLSRLVVEVQPDGTAKRYRRQVERVLSDAGASQLDRRAFQAWPGEEEIRVLSADVRREDGTTDAARTGRTGGRGRVVVDLPPLAAGDVVDLEWRHDDLRTTHFGNYFGLDAPFALDDRLPARESEIVVIVPESFPLTLNPRLPEGATYETSRREDGATVHRWVATGLTPRHREHLQPPAIEGASRVQASSYASWEEFGRWWWNLIEDEIRVSTEMKAKVAQLVEGKETPLERLRAVYDFVVTEVRYNAWEFGVHGYQPYSAPVIFSRRFGDCKDKAILLRAMLSEVDIEAWPVLIRMEDRRFEEDHELALVGHFNHCIAYIPEQAGLPEMYLDGTARLHPLGVLPDSDRGARVLIVRDDGSTQARIPFGDAEDNRLDDEFAVDLRDPAAPSVEWVRKPRGRFDPNHRHRFTGNEVERDETVQDFVTARFGALEGPPRLEQVDFEDLTQPLELRFNAKPVTLGRDAPGGFEVPTAFEELDLLRNLASESERTTDLLLDVPWMRRTRIDYRFPEGTDVGELPEAIEHETEDIRYTRTIRRAPGGVRIEEEVALLTHRVPRERYAAFREVCRAIDAARSAAVSVEEVR